MTKVADIRNALSLTQSALAALLGVQQSTVSRWESGKLPLDERTDLALEALAARAKEAA